MSSANAKDEDQDDSKETPEKTIGSERQGVEQPPHENPVCGAEKKKKRTICSRCERPRPRACLCSALPEHRLFLQKCHLLVLQHPHEIRRKNCSLFLAEFCLTPDSMTTVRARKWLPASNGATSMVSINKTWLSPERDVWLVYPHAQAIPLGKALAERRQKSQSTSLGRGTQRALTLIFLDAAWKFAAEMERASQFPPHVQYVCLDADDLQGIKPKRFDIRTPPSPEHLSTAECLALVVSRVEDNPEIYATIIKPLDLMVSQWHAFADQKKEKSGN